MSIIYQKTDAGRLEIETRANHLEMRLRRVLILVDGKKDVLAITKMALGNDNVEAALLSLQDAGYISPLYAAVLEQDILSDENTLTRSNDFEPLTIFQTTVFRDTLGEAQTITRKNAPETLTFEQKRTLGARIINQNLGPLGEDAAIALERAKTPEALEAAVLKAAAQIGMLQGQAKAQDFKLRLGFQ